MDKKHNWHQTLIPVHTTILNAIQLMDTVSLRVLMVINPDQQLLGIITDGDIRRYLLKQASLSETVDQVMNIAAVTATLSDTRSQLLHKMQLHEIMHLPILDHDNKIVGLETFESLFSEKVMDNDVIFMAGGLGKRLHPLTETCPKSLIRIGNKPVSEILLENFIESGFRCFYFSINYKANMIRDHFGSGNQWGVSIQYVEERDALGTAGSLSLLPTMPTKSFFVANSDILTKINFSYLLNYHREHKAHATLCVREYINTVPFGVVEIDKNNYRILGVNEKPKKTVFVSAGIYILEPEVLKLLPFNTYCDMPQFLNSLAKEGYNVTAFPIHEYWLDIGRHDDLEKAIKDYPEVFA